MLTHQEKELLTAFVDGELTQRQRKDAASLLHGSNEAREFLRQLQENAHKLKSLPRRKVEPSLKNDVLAAIEQAKQRSKSQPASRPMPARRRWKPYLAASLAASLLIATVGALYYQSMIDDANRTPNDPGLLVDNNPQPKKTPDKTPETPPRRTPNPLIAQVIDGTFSQFGAPIPPERVFSANFTEFRKEGTTTANLTYELNKEKAGVHLDVKVKNNAVAMERIKSALHDRGIQLMIDPESDKAIKKSSQAKLEYWVYAENLTTDEVTKMLKELSFDDNRLQKNSATPFEKVVLNPLTKGDKATVSAMLGVEPAKMENPGPKMNDPTAPPKRWERAAAVLPQSTAPSASQEMRTFVEQRRSLPGTAPVLIRIHQD